MSITTTQIIQVAIPTSATIEDASSIAGRTWNSLTSLLKSAKGSKNIYWGRTVEDPGNVVLLIEWENQAASKEAAESDAITSALTAVAKLAQAVTGVKSFHVDFQHSLTVPLTSPCTEFSLLFFPAGATEARSTYASKVFAFMDKVSSHPQSSKGFASGWTSEELANPQDGSQNGTAFVSALGWESMEAHYAFNETDTVKENIGPLATGGATGWQIMHIQAKKI